MRDLYDRKAVRADKRTARCKPTWREPYAGLLRSARNDRRVCRVCGCDDNHACLTDDGLCYWVEDDLCSACVGKTEV
jgi:hypothetical protein